MLCYALDLSFRIELSVVELERAAHGPGSVSGVIPETGRNPSIHIVPHGVYSSPRDADRPAFSSGRVPFNRLGIQQPS